MKMEFNSLLQLYKRLKPALTAKTNEMRMQGYKYIKEDDVWNYLKEVKWSKSKNLLLFEMVRDVLNVDSLVIDDYVRGKLNSKERTVYFNEV